jgi:acyl-CoA synthetase (AMP-forming)/AMP-acid ligase II
MLADFGDAPALVSTERTWTYAELDRAVDEYGAGLLARGVERGDVVGVHGWSRPEWLIAFLACSRIGAIYLGLSPKSTGRELEYLLADARPRLVLGIDGVAPSELRGSGAERADHPDLPCAIVYTSGSTGAPKGALLSQRSILRSARLTAEHWHGAGPETRTVAELPIDHVGWLVCECLAVLVAGGTIHFRERFDAAGVLRLIEAERLTLWVAFPSMLALAMQTPEFERCDLSSLRRVALASTPSLELLTRLRTRTDAVFTASYGLTEASGGAVTASAPDADLATVAGTIGRVVPGLEHRVDAATGELLLRDECVFDGYLNRPQATAAAIDDDGWLHTGDAVSVEADGNLRLVGRLKEMFKSGGYNVYPSEVENVLGSHPAVSEVAVVAAPDPLWTEVGVAFVVPAAALDSEELREHARERLANYKVPKRLLLVDALPRLPNGKVDKLSLRKAIG